MAPTPSPSTRVAVAAAALIAVVLGGAFIPQLLRRPPAVGADASVVATSASARTAAPSTCPETAARSGAHSEPRNAAGQVRFCWPGEPKCQCDSDNDCYALSGYVPCTPPVAAIDAGRVAIDSGRVAIDAGRVAIDVPTATDARLPRDAGQVAPDVGPTRADAGRATIDAPAVTPPATGIAAFPGAEGFGAQATGGRGGRVIYVTNLNRSGPGSLQDAVSQSGPRYVLFKVSGVIDGDVQIRNGDLTVAGQTSPGGVVVRGLHTTEEPYCDQQCGPSARGVSNFVVRHLRSRPAGGGFPDGLRLRYARNAVIDHVSVGNAEDEAVEISYSNAITIQDCILAETVGGHAQYGGMLINYTNPAAGYALDNLSIVRNVWNRVQGRLPEFSRESGSAAAGTTLHVELTNNLIWDQRYFIDVNPTNVSGGTSGSAVNYQINWVGNWAQARPGTSYGVIWLQRVARSTTTAYFSDNRSSLWPARQDWDLNYCCSDYRGGSGSRPSWARATRHPFPAVSAMPASAVRAYAFAHAGAFPRDAMDRRLMSYVNAGTFDQSAVNVNPAGDALRLDFAASSPPAAPSDRDGDGMPDAWESANGLNPSAQDHNGTSLSVAFAGVPGYTNLEVYLAGLANQRVLTGR